MATEQATLAASTLSGRYTELPKVHELVSLGVRPELITTYAALTDYANNRTGECYPQMKTIARMLGRSVRTVQRHLHELADFGLVKFVKRLRDETGRYRGYLYRIFHSSRIADRRKQKRREKEERERERKAEKARRKQRRSNKPSTGHERPVREDSRTSRENNYPPDPPKKDPKEGYEWFFGERSSQPTPDTRDNHRKGDPKEGYEWFFR